MIGYLLIAMAAISILSGIFVWRMVHRPVRELKIGTMHLARGDLGYQIDLHRHDELGDLAGSFNHMSRQLHEAQEQLTDWARTLETRVEKKSCELRLAHDHVVQVEKMASLGKLSATVAHEINNPLSGILTYAKLLKKWIGRTVGSGDERNEMLHSLELIESESRRCGELVKNLLMFARAAPMNMGWTRPSAIVERCLRLIHHRIELAGTQLHRDIDPEDPLLYCDRAQVEQVLLALLVNALEAMPRGGNLSVRTRVRKAGRAIEIQVQDNGAGIPPEVLPKMFEPFFTTKEGTQEVGLGLAVSSGIVQRHGGEITAESDMGRGTTFTVTLPLDHGRTQPAPTEGGEAAA
jgi:two-component system NtrC family sensor kinase